MLLEVLQAAPSPYTLDEFQRTLFTGVLSAPVLIAIGAGGMKIRQARKDGRLKLRTDAQDADNDLVEHWKQAAVNAQAAAAEQIAQERESKKSAIETVRALLELQEAQNVTLRETIDRLTTAIEALNTAGGAAAELVGALRAERDALQTRLDQALLKVAALTAQLMSRQKDLLASGDPDTQELAVLNAELQRRADTGPTPVQEGSAR